MTASTKKMHAAWALWLILRDVNRTALSTMACESWNASIIVGRVVPMLLLVTAPVFWCKFRTLFSAVNVKF